MSTLAIPMPVERPDFGTFLLDFLTGLVFVVTHPTGVRNTLCNTVVDLLDADSPTPGTLEFQTVGSVEVATCTFGDPAFGAATGGTATANAITSDTNATGGTIAQFVAQDGTGDDVFLGSVTAPAGGGDIELSSVTPSGGDTVGMDSLTYSAAA